MTALQGLFGPVAIGVICGILFIEEVGVPLPMFPASGLLLVAGVMIGAGDISPWLFLPLAYGACVGGALLGYTWSRHLGQARLQRLAERLRVRRHLDRVAERLHRAGAMGVMVGRLVPGSRVYTSLIAGVTGMPLFTFVRGLLASDVVWLAVLVGLGVVLGVSAADYLDVALGLFLRGVVAAVLLLAALGVLRLVRPPVGPVNEARPLLLRLAAAIAPDAAIVAAAALATSLVLTFDGVVTGAVGVAIVVAATLLVYVVGTRLAFRGTAGERLGGLSYRDLLPDVL